MPRPAAAARRGASWRVGPLVLKPLDRAPREIAWQAEVLSGVQSEGVPRAQWCFCVMLTSVFTPPTFEHLISTPIPTG
jgi:hypothetical protein